MPRQGKQGQVQEDRAGPRRAGPRQAGPRQAGSGSGLRGKKRPPRPKTSARPRKPPRSSRPRKKLRRRRRGFPWRRWLLALILLGCGVLAWMIWPLWQLAGQFAPHPSRQPSRLYGQPLSLRANTAWTVESLVEQLRALSYVNVETAQQMMPGSYRTFASGVEIFRRLFPSADGPAGGNRLSVRIEDGRLRGLESEGRSLSEAYLDPPLIASFYGSDLQERRPFLEVDEDLPEDLILSVLAAEDAQFLTHKGISLTGTLRAAWINLMEREVRQGGSTLTQQLVKNVFLTHERTWTRKAREALLAIFLEVRYDKREIFRAYLNEIYWGRSGAVDLMGVGAAAWGYFGKEPIQLSLSEAATLAGMIQSPAYYSPFSAPRERILERRNFVLGRLAQLRWVETERLEAAAREPLLFREKPLVARRAPYFTAAMEQEARRRFKTGDLSDAGYVLVSTLSPEDQRRAEAAVSEGLVEVEEKWEKKNDRTLQAALISVEPQSGAILAYVGGRDYGESQFDRVSQARRQPGSAFKPVVFAAALAAHAATPASIFEDAPFEVRYDDKLWSPKNSDGTYRGRVSARSALEESLNVPTAQMALRTGLGPIIDLAHAMGIEAEIRPFPALALGTMEVTPLEMATVYSTLASGGVRPSVHGLEAIYDRAGHRMEGEDPPPSERVLDENVAFLVNRLLQGVLDRGTGRNARRDGVTDPLAGKTGTTNSRRDSWFAGYSPDRATLVWVGYDDNATTRLSGTRAALPIWTRFVREVRPPGGFANFRQPSGVVGAWIDPRTGALATDRCPGPVAEFFLKEFLPAELCPDHGGRWARPLPQPDGVEIETQKEKRHPFREWLRMLRGKKNKPRG